MSGEETSSFHCDDTMTCSSNRNSCCTGFKLSVSGQKFLISISFIALVSYYLNQMGEADFHS